MYDELVKRLREHGEFLIVKDRMAAPPNVNVRNAFAEDYAQAADAIEELQKEVEFEKALAECWEELAHDCQARFRKLLEAFPKWISVEERLPEPNAVDKYGFAKGYLVKTDRHVMMHTARYNGEWWILWGKAEVITDTVTHWMPLPELPKEE